MNGARRQPNILFIMADQFRWDFLGAMGAGFVHTPYLDMLAADGTLFTHCFTNSPVCAPARTGLATALQPVRMGHLDNHAFLPLRQPTYYQRLRDYGYRVGCVGKLDLGKPDAYNGRYGDRPITYAWGFTHPEECEGKMHAGKGNPPNGPYTYWLAERGLVERFTNDYRRREEAGWLWAAAWDSVLPADAFEDAYIGSRAVEWLRWVPDDFPWHYLVSFVGPHNPFDPPWEYADRYRTADVPPAVNPEGQGKPVPVTETATPAQIALCRRQYCAAIEAIDDQIGRILAVLEARGQRDNTVIVFASDHGEMLGDHGRWTKGVFYEGSIRVPLLIAGPGLPRGARTDALVELIDVNPTLCELAGVGAMPLTDATSLLPLLRGESEAVHDEVVSQIRSGRCIRTRDWKMIQGAGGHVELHDLANDPDELRNVADARSDIVRRLSSRLTERYLEGACLR